jgi:hypothetical protein
MSDANVPRSGPAIEVETPVSDKTAPSSTSRHYIKTDQSLASTKPTFTFLLPRLPLPEHYKYIPDFNSFAHKYNPVYMAEEDAYFSIHVFPWAIQQEYSIERAEDVPQQL